MLNPKWAREAKLQLSSRVAKIISVARGRCVVQCTDGRRIANVHFALGRVFPVDTWVQIERVNQDWQVVGIGMAYTSSPSTPVPPLPPLDVIYGLWISAEAFPRITLATSTPQDQVRLAEGTFQDLFITEQTADNSGYIYEPNRTDYNGMVLYSLGDKLNPTDVVLVSLNATWETTGAALSTKLQLYRWSLKTSELLSVANFPATVSRYYSEGNPLVSNPNTQAGYLFLHQLENDEVFITIVCDEKIICYRPSPGESNSCTWKTGTSRLPTRSMCVGVAEEYLFEGSYLGVLQNEGGSSFISGGVTLEIYKRTGTQYEHSFSVDLLPVLPGNILAASTSGNPDAGVFPVGILDALPDYDIPEDPEESPQPQEGTAWQNQILNTRWPVLSFNQRKEVWMWVNMLADPMPHFVTIAVELSTGVATVVDDFVPNLSWKFLYSNVVEKSLDDAVAAGNFCKDITPTYTAENGLGVSGTCTIGLDGHGSNIAGTIVVHRDIEILENLDADPPQAASTVDRSVAYNYLGGVTGRTYSGVIPQTPFVNTADYNSQDRFFTAPSHALRGPDAVNMPETSAQSPSGVINGSGIYVSVCFEPQHYVTNLATVDDVPQELRNWDDPIAYDNFYTLMTSNSVNESYPAATDYLWSINKRGRTIGEGGDGTGLPAFPLADPYLTLSAPAKPEDFVGNPPPYGEYNPEIGNAYELLDKIYYKIYAIRSHMEYVYGIWHRTMINVLDARTKTLKYRYDISQYLVDGPLNGYAARNPTPQKLMVWFAQTVGEDHLWVLRQRYVNTTPDGAGNQTTGDIHPYLELYHIGETELTLLSRLMIYPTGQEGQSLQEAYWRPHMTVGTKDGKPYATIYTTWDQQLITEVTWTGSVLTSHEIWNPGDEYPNNAQARTAVQHDKNLYFFKSPFGPARRGEVE